MQRARSRFLLGLLVGAALAVGALAFVPGRKRPAWSEEDRAMAARMHAFSQALTKPPQNSDPAPGWQPLLKDARPGERMCALCHGDSGTRMEHALDDGSLVPAGPASEPSREEMIALMERWMRELNRHGRDRLAKAVHCLDCHETDPRG